MIRVNVGESSKKGTDRAKPTTRNAFLFFVALFLTGAFVRIAHLGDVRSRTPDERNYVREAQRIRAQGFNGEAATARKLGYTVLLAAGMAVAHVENQRIGVALSFCCSLLTLALLGYIAFRFLPATAALYAMLAMSLSVVDLVFSRRIWQEALVEFLALVIIGSACEITRNHLRWFWYGMLCACGFIIVLVKQHVVFFCCIVLLYVMSVLFRRRAWRQLFVLCGSFSVAIGLGILALAMVVGSVDELERLIATMFFAYTSVAGAAPGTQYQAGPWYLFLKGLWILTPHNVFLALFAASLSFLPAGSFQKLGCSNELVSLLRLFAATTVCFFAIVLLFPFAQNFRYLAPIYGTMYMLAGFGIWVAWNVLGSVFHKRAMKLGVAVGLLAAILFGASQEYRTFEELFVRLDIQDLSIAQVLLLPRLQADAGRGAQPPQRR